jgi:hypothetical protein
VGHRAEKNRLRHGFITKMEGSGEKATYRTERPPQPPQHTAHTSARTRTAYRAVKALTGTQAPKRGHLNHESGRQEWNPRHRDASPRRKAAAA